MKKLREKALRLYNKRSVRYALVTVFLLNLGVIAFLMYIYYWMYDDQQKELAISAKFNQEMRQTPNLLVQQFMLWEGDSMVTAKVDQKGHVQFWYGTDGVPRITQIGSYTTSFTCFYVDPSGKKTRYAFDRSLDLANNTDFDRWFSFRVTNLRDLVEKYDAITQVLNGFPEKGETVEFKDSWGTRDVLKTPNPEFALKQTFKGQTVSCDLYR